MGIIRTDQWMQKEFNRPIKICERLIPYFDGQKSNAIYYQLLNFGMFKPSIASWETYENMLEEHKWDKVDDIFRRYRQKWSGPEIPVFLFPIEQARGFFRKEERSKSGVSFSDKLFLFLSQDVGQAELEALFVHEYHHVCRLNKLRGKIEDYTLLDSMIIEGLAEYAVQRHCGKKYLAEWCSLYSEDEINYIWNKYLKDNLMIKKKDKRHDDLLYGNGRFPKLAGYAAGYWIVREYYQNHAYLVEKSFSLPAKRLIEGTKYK
jgi:uncharacterized protein YjaZ